MRCLHVAIKISASKCMKRFTLIQKSLRKFEEFCSVNEKQISSLIKRSMPNLKKNYSSEIMFTEILMMVLQINKGSYILNDGYIEGFRQERYWQCSYPPCFTEISVISSSKMHACGRYETLMLSTKATYTVWWVFACLCAEDVELLHIAVQNVNHIIGRHTSQFVLNGSEQLKSPKFYLFSLNCDIWSV